MSVFKNYEAGEPTCRLYVKNIAKQVDEKVGTFIAGDPFNIFVYWSIHLLQIHSKSFGFK